MGMVLVAAFCILRHCLAVRFLVLFSNIDEITRKPLSHAAYRWLRYLAAGLVENWKQQAR